MIRGVGLLCIRMSITKNSCCSLCLSVDEWCLRGHSSFPFFIRWSRQLTTNSPEVFPGFTLLYDRYLSWWRISVRDSLKGFDFLFSCHFFLSSFFFLLSSFFLFLLFLFFFVMSQYSSTRPLSHTSSHIYPLLPFHNKDQV